MQAAKWSDDWRITLGITLGMLCFSAYCVVTDTTPEQAWLTIQVITGICIGGSTIKEWIKK